MSVQAMVQEFHETFGHPVALTPGLIPKERAAFRVSLIEEELQELKDAIEAGDLVEIADALGDLDVVVNGAALEYGVRMDAVVKEIHASNMSKLGEDGEPILREDDKILKGANFWPPRLDVVLEGQGWHGETYKKSEMREPLRDVADFVADKLHNIRLGVYSSLKEGNLRETLEEIERILR